MADSDPATVLTPRPLGRVNWLGLWTLYDREVRRFLKVYMQTLLAPVITTLLFLAIFTLALGSAVHSVKGVAFATFLAPGLMMMQMIQNAFANTSSSIMIGKIQGNIVDILMPPLSPAELTAGFVLGGMTRGLMVGLVAGLTMALFVHVPLAHPLMVLYYGVSASVTLATVGLMGGLWAEKFDHLQAVSNFVIMPLSFLSGTFYSVDRLEGVFHWLAWINPFFYMIDGFRHGFLGHGDAPVALGLAVTLGVNVVLVLGCYRLMAHGYKLKA